MKRLIVLDEESGMVETQQITVESRCAISEHIKTLQEKMAHKPIFLPYGDRGCACFASKENRRFFLMYLAPDVKRVITYNPEGGTAEHKQYDIHFPHTYIGMFFRGGAIEGGYAFVAKTKIITPEEMIGRLPVPNTNENAKLCEGNAAAFATHRDPTVTTNSYLEFFMKSNFTPHIMSHLKLLPQELRPANANADDQYRESWKKAQDEIFTKWQAESEKGGEHVAGLAWQDQWPVEKVVADYWQENRRGRF